ncbi:MAG: hypothetical protein DCF19_15360 [Pseudanabaena frigida]|uniref:Peptidase C14 caspase domain-containing protein n=1 Tax=Pseudanabaena frigida TaxID=945775 RepID=A0A2W4WAC1_9CYAN|nr:MAG: hypothetical protein DCF19_15360 [Pseudanabaena frigida]
MLTDGTFCAYPNTPDHVRLLQDQEANRKAILDGLEWLKACADRDKDATIVIYYSGHGTYDLSSNAYYLL